MTHSRTAIAAVLLILVCRAAAMYRSASYRRGKDRAITATASVSLARRPCGTTWVLSISEKGHTVSHQNSLAVPRNNLAHARGGASLWTRDWPILPLVATICAAGDVRLLPERERPQQLRADRGRTWTRRPHQLFVSAGDRDSGALRRRTLISHPLIRLALAAFILTWLGGHPLLVAEVAYPFWITLGWWLRSSRPIPKRTSSARHH